MYTGSALDEYEMPAHTTNLAKTHQTVKFSSKVFGQRGSVLEVNEISVRVKIKN